MEAKELRIGNLVRYTQYEELKPNRRGKITTVTGDDISFIHDTEPDYIEPIPLTHEWLEIFGFTQSGYDLEEWEHEKHHSIWFIGTEYEKNDEGGWLGFNYNLSESGDRNVLDSQFYIKHVHQLQNLVFALAREELTVSE